MGKIKFLPESNYSLKEVVKDFPKVENPTIYKNLPNGRYHIRGNQKNHASYYLVYNNRWYLVEERIEDNGHWITEAAKYQLFPQLAEKEWSILNNVPIKRFNKYWQRSILGYNFYKELKEVDRSIKVSFLKFKK